MSAAELSERPKAVTVIGWVFLVASLLYVLRSALNLIILEILQATAPELLLRLAVLSRPWVPEWLLRNTGAIYAGQVAFSIAVAYCAWGFLALKPWARRFLQVICLVLLAFDAGFAVFWLGLWTGAGGGRVAALPSTASRHGQILYSGLLVLATWAVLLGLALFFLQSAAVRGAFTPRLSAPAET